MRDRRKRKHRNANGSEHLQKDTEMREMLVKETIAELQGKGKSGEWLGEERKRK